MYFVIRFIVYINSELKLFLHQISYILGKN